MVIMLLPAGRRCPTDINSRTMVNFGASCLLAAAALAVVVSPVTANYYSCELSAPIVLDNDGLVELQQFINEDEGTFTMQLTYYGGQSYLGIGVNQDGRSRMFPAIATIGRADGSSALVEKYSLDGYSGGVGLMAPSAQEGIFNTSFVQTESTSTLTFTQLLEEPGQVAVSDDSQWIFAVGYPGNRFGGHAIRGSFRLSFYRSCTFVTAAPEEEMTEPPVEEATEPPEVEEQQQVVEQEATEPPVVEQEATVTPVVVEEPAIEDEEAETAEQQVEEVDAAPTVADPPIATEPPLSMSASSSCPLTAPIPLDANGELELQQFVNVDEGTFTIKLTYYGGQAWIGIGINDDGIPEMTPATAVIGRADTGGTVQKYRLTAQSGVQPAEALQQTLVNTTFVQTDETSTLTFTQLLNEPGRDTVADNSQWIYAVGFPGNNWMGHSIQGSFKLTLTPTCGADGVDPTTDASSAEAGIIFSNVAEPDEDMWKMHGIMMAMAWAICAPIAIGASVLRTGFARLGLTNNQGLWFKIHLFMNLGTALFTLAGFVIAVVAKNQEQIENSVPVDHFEGTHAKMGLSIFILVLLQSLAGMFRPSLSKQEVPASSSGSGRGDNKKRRDEEDLDKTERDTSAHIDFSSSSLTSKDNQKSTLRIGWEWFHRLTGLTLLAMAWYNCHTGIVWSSMVWEENDDWTPAFWGFVGSLVGIIVVARIVLQVTE